MKPATCLKNRPVIAIDFGADDGKFDSIEKYFFDTGLLTEIEKGRKLIITGRKGTGKTAIAKYLKEKARASHDRFVNVLSFKDIPVGLLEQFEDKDFKHANKFILLWRYIFLVELSKLIINDESITSPEKKKLECFINLNFPTLKGSPQEYLKETIEKKLKLSLQVIEGEVSSKTEEGILNLLHFTNDLQRLTRRLATLGNKYFIIIDELDDSYGDSKEYSSILTGMFKAGMDLNAFFKEEYKQCRIIMMLRSDIYADLMYADKNKWSDMTHEINWIPLVNQHLQDSDLFKLINLRIGASLKDQVEGNENYWDIIFPKEPIFSDLRSFSFMLSRSYYRPRDIIQFCKKIQDSVPKHERRACFFKEDIINAEIAYSNWFRNELIDELRVKIPCIQEVFEAIKNHGRPTFTAHDINNRFNAFNLNQDSLNILEMMFEFSIIGIFIDDVSPPIFRFRDPTIGFIKNKKYSIHYGLRGALRLEDRFLRRPGESEKTAFYRSKFRKNHSRGAAALKNKMS